MTINVIALLLAADCFHADNLWWIEKLDDKAVVNMSLVQSVVKDYSACPEAKGAADKELAALKEAVAKLEPKPLPAGDAKAKTYVEKEAPPDLHEFNEDFRTYLKVERVVAKEKAYRKVVNAFGVPVEKSRRIEVVFRIKDQPLCLVVKGAQVESYRDEDRDQPVLTRLEASEEGKDTPTKIIACR